MADPEYKFKFYDRINPITGSKEYQTLMMTEVDGKPVTYRSSYQRSKQAAQDDINRMISGINATQSGTPRTVSQDYGSSKVTVGPSEEIKTILESGGSLNAPETYTTQRGNQDGTVTRTTYDQRGIRQADPITTYAANMLDPNYNAALDAIVDPTTGQPIFQNAYAASMPSEVLMSYGSSQSAPQANAQQQQTPLNLNMPEVLSYTSGVGINGYNPDVIVSPSSSPYAYIEDLLKKSVI